jgi:hypothetical protein
MKSSSGTLGGGDLHIRYFDSYKRLFIVNSRDSSYSIRQTDVVQEVQCVSSDSSFVIRRTGREDSRGPARNGASCKQSLIVSCYN